MVNGFFLSRSTTTSKIPAGSSAMGQRSGPACSHRRKISRSAVMSATLLFIRSSSGVDGVRVRLGPAQAFASTTPSMIRARNRSGNMFAYHCPSTEP